MFLIEQSQAGFIRSSAKEEVQSAVVQGVKGGYGNLVSFGMESEESLVVREAYQFRMSRPVAYWLGCWAVLEEVCCLVWDLEDEEGLSLRWEEDEVLWWVEVRDCSPFGWEAFGRESSLRERWDLESSRREWSDLD